MTFAEKQKQYADILVTLGVNVQSGQELVIRCDTAAAPFARIVTAAAYTAGAR